MKLSTHETLTSVSIQNGRSQLLPPLPEAIDNRSAGSNSGVGCVEGISYRSHPHLDKQDCINLIYLGIQAQKHSIFVLFIVYISFSSASITARQPSCSCKAGYVINTAALFER